MSVNQMDKVFKHSRSVGGARLVLLALADVASDDGEVSAYARSQTIISQKARLSERSVRSALRVLVDLGELEILKLGDGRKSTDYRILLSESRAEATAPPGRKDVTPQGGSSSPPRAEAGGTPISPSSSVVVPSLPIPSWFDSFWEVYPRKIGKGDAAVAYEKARKKVGHEIILSGVQRFAEFTRRSATEQKFIPYPATWLNRGRWDDDLDAENQPRMPRGADATLRSMEAMRNAR